MKDHKTYYVWSVKYKDGPGCTAVIRIGADNFDDVLSIIRKEEVCELSDIKAIQMCSLLNIHGAYENWKGK